MIDIIKRDEDIIEIAVDGKILHDDYQRVLPEFENIIARHGSMRCLIEVGHIKGMQPKAVLDDLKFDIKHAKDIRRCAIVSDANWHRSLTRLWGWFMPKCKVETFKPEQRAEAAAWVREVPVTQSAHG